MLHSVRKDKMKSTTKDYIKMLKERLDSPYTDEADRLEILEFFHEMLTFDWLGSVKKIDKHNAELRRLANGEE